MKSRGKEVDPPNEIYKKIVTATIVESRSIEVLKTVWLKNDDALCLTGNPQGLHKKERAGSRVRQTLNTTPMFSVKAMTTTRLAANVAHQPKPYPPPERRLCASSEVRRREFRVLRCNGTRAESPSAVGPWRSARCRPVMIAGRRL